jgi:hypothetical protein
LPALENRLVDVFDNVKNYFTLLEKKIFCKGFPYDAGNEGNDAGNGFETNDPHQKPRWAYVFVRCGQ